MRMLLQLSSFFAEMMVHKSAASLLCLHDSLGACCVCMTALVPAVQPDTAKEPQQVGCYNMIMMAPLPFTVASAESRAACDAHRRLCASGYAREQGTTELVRAN